MDKSQAVSEILRLFGAHRAKISLDDRRWLRTRVQGKMYELVCLNRVLRRLQKEYGFQVGFSGKSIRLKGAPSAINRSDGHFYLFNHPGIILFKVYTDLEVRTLGSSIGLVGDNSGYFEVDIAVVEPTVTGRPKHSEVALAVECKSHAAFQKSFIREVLALRRELSLLTEPRATTLAGSSSLHTSASVPAKPPSEVWLAYVDKKGNNYRNGPSVFGIELLHWPV